MSGWNSSLFTFYSSFELMTSAVMVATATFATAFAAVATAATSTLSGDDVVECLDLLLGSIVHAEYLTLKYEVHTCVGVIEVDGYSLFLYLYYEAIHALALSIDEGDDVACIDLLVVKLAIHAEDILIYVEYEVFAAVAVALL